MQLNHYNTNFKQKTFPITVVCDNVTNAPNLGSLFRICDAFGVKELILCGSYIPLGRKMTKTSRATENVVKHMDFTAGILLGRTTLEGWCCDVPGYIYLIDVNGNLTEIETTLPDNIKEMCNSRYVANQHIELYKKIIK